MRRSIGSLLVLFFLSGILSAETAEPVKRKGKLKTQGPDMAKAVRVERRKSPEKVLYLKNAEESPETYGKKVEARKLKLERQRLENLIEKYKNDNNLEKLKEAQVALDKLLHPWKYRKAAEKVTRVRSGKSFKVKKISPKNAEESK